MKTFNFICPFCDNKILIVLQKVIFGFTLYIICDICITYYVIKERRVKNQTMKDSCVINYYLTIYLWIRHFKCRLVNKKIL